MKPPSPPLYVRTRGYRLAAETEFERFVRQHGLEDRAGFEALIADARATPGGRGVNLLVTDTRSGKEIRLRPNRHGGWLASLLGDRFLSPRRAMRELETSRLLGSRGIPVPPPILALGIRRGFFWRCFFATRNLSQAQDASSWLARQPGEPELQRVGEACARTLRRMHDAGFIHGDLHLRNLLIASSDEEELDDGQRGEWTSGREPTCFLIDFDRIRIRRRVSPADRMREWVRLGRSIEKQGFDKRFDAALRGQLLRTYCQGDEDLRSAMLASLPREARRTARHRLAWRVERRLRGLTRRAGMLAIALTLFNSLSGCSQETLELPSNSDDIRHSFLAVGDTGRTRPLARLFEGQRSVASSMTQEAERLPVDEMVLLGDNFYWNGLDREHLVPRIRENLVRPYCYFLRLDGPRSDEVVDACSLPLEQRRPVPIYAVLGNHDLELPESAQLQREVVPDFLPEWRMSRGLAEVFELGDGLSLILFESEPEINEAEKIGRAIESAVREARGPWRILATHRPIATDDLGYPRLGGYPDFVRKGLVAAGRPVQLVLTAHHHNLQIFEIGPPIPSLHAVVGGGARAEAPIAQDHPDARFGRITTGFARIDLIGTGSDERLSLTLFEAPRWPFLAWLAPAQPIARFEVNRTGGVLRK